VPASNYGGAPIPAGAKSAAQIIWDAAQTFNISPRVLLVTIQKESAGPLTTDDWPFEKQYKYAMGAHCPDNPPPEWPEGCDPNYSGFSMQIYESADLFRWYLDNMNQPWWSYKKPGNNNILYNPNTGCGSSNVYIETMATAALYTYTPYQPNQAALNNLYGTGDGCSAYGNRNFWRIYNDWFGSTRAPNFDWTLVSQSLYTDSSKTTGSSNSILAGNKAYAVIKIKNTGNLTWTKNSTNTVRFGTIRPLERRSVFCDATWLSCSRPAAMVEDTVAPDGIATFEFWLQTPMQGGSYNEYFGPVVEGVQWMRDIGLFYNINVQPPTYTWQMTSQYAYTDQTKTTVKNMNNIAPGEKVYVGFTAKNTGSVTWSNSGINAILAGTSNPLERSSAFAPGSNWLSGTKPTLLKETTVAPGQTGTFEFWLTAPATLGIYNERFNIIANGITWFNDTGLSYYANIHN
jgi:hypothetical protein